MDEVGKKWACCSVELGQVSGLGLVQVERWSWVRIPLDLWIFFLPLLKFSKLFWRASLPVLEALNFIHSLIIIIRSSLQLPASPQYNISTINLTAPRVLHQWCSFLNFLHPQVWTFWTQNSRYFSLYYNCGYPCCTHVPTLTLTTYLGGPFHLDGFMQL